MQTWTQRIRWQSKTAGWMERLTSSLQPLHSHWASTNPMWGLSFTFKSQKVLKDTLKNVEELDETGSLLIASCTIPLRKIEERITSSFIHPHKRQSSERKRIFMSCTVWLISVKRLTSAGVLWSKNTLARISISRTVEEHVTTAKRKQKVLSMLIWLIFLTSYWEL